MRTRESEYSGRPCCWRSAFEANSGIIPPAQMKNVHGFGWMPGIDVGQSHQPYAATPEQKACLDGNRPRPCAPRSVLTGEMPTQISSLIAA